MKCIFSVDVEDWFHILDVPATPPLDAWDALPSHVEKNFLVLLDLFSEKGAQVTCFFLGYVARRFPALVREARRRGHEIASHGYAHRLVYQQTRAELLEDVRRAKGVLEDVAGVRVDGYRSPGFSVTGEAPWFFDVLVEAGHRYDSSVFPAPRGHGGLRTKQYAPHRLRQGQGELVEFPITVLDVLGAPRCFFGGGYLRLTPYPVLRAMSERVLAEHRPVVFYVHPREIDPHHPRLPMSLGRRFKCYVNLGTTAGKIARILDDFDVTTFARFIDTEGIAAPASAAPYRGGATGSASASAAGSAGAGAPVGLAS